MTIEMILLAVLAMNVSDDGVRGDAGCTGSPIPTNEDKLMGCEPYNQNLSEIPEIQTIIIPTEDGGKLTLVINTTEFFSNGSIVGSPINTTEPFIIGEPLQ